MNEIDLKLGFSLLVMAVLTLLPGCGDGQAPVAKPILHLNPLLADGIPSPPGLAEIRHEGASQIFAPARRTEGPWKLQRHHVIQGGDGDYVRVKRKFSTSGPVGALRLLHTRVLLACRHDIFALDLLMPTAGRARMGWRCEGEPKEVQHFLKVEIPASDKVQRICFYPGISYPGLHADWSGRIETLWIEPEWENEQGVVMGIQAIHQMEAGFLMGHEPLEDEPGDGGLVELGHEARRAWPTDYGVPLFAKCVVPEKGVFFASAAVLAWGGKKRNALFQVHARAPGGGWQLLQTRPVASEHGWSTIRAELSAFSGREIELRLSAVQKEGDALRAGSPKRGVCLWAEPVIHGPGFSPQRPSVLLVTLDTTRADHTLDSGRCPALTRLGEQGVVFENAWSSCNVTTPSHASILTGVHAFEHGAVNNFMTLTSDNTTLAERFREAGYQTGAAVSVSHLHAGVGFGQGFDRFTQSSKASALNGHLTVEPVIRWIEEWGGEGRGPFFLWLHLFDPHTPYGPPEEYTDLFADRVGIAQPSAQTDPRTFPVPDKRAVPPMKWLKDVSNHEYVTFLYSAGVSYTDHLLDQVLKAAGNQGLSDNMVTLVTADHGESLGEHNIWYSHAGLYEESLRVPLVLKVPGGPAGQRLDSPVTTLDIAPTLISLCKLESMADMRGQDLLALTQGDGDPDRRLWFEYTNLSQIAMRDGQYHFIATLSDGLKYGLPRGKAPGMLNFKDKQHIAGGTHFLYHLENDPGLEQNLAEQDPERVKAYLALVKRWQESLTRRNGGQREISNEEMERLRALGYGGH